MTDQQPDFEQVNPDDVECVHDHDVLKYIHEMLDRGTIGIFRTTQMVGDVEVVFTHVQLVDGPPPYRTSQQGIPKAVAIARPEVLVGMIKLGIWSLRRFIDSTKKPKPPL